MNDDALYHQVAAIIGERLMIDPATITPDTTADDVNGWDSVTHTLLIMEVERRLGVAFPLDRIFDLTNVGDLVTLVAAQLSGNRKL